MRQRTTDSPAYFNPTKSREEIERAFELDSYAELEGMEDLDGGVIPFDSPLLTAFVGPGLEEDEEPARFPNPMPRLDELVGPGLPGQYDRAEDD